MPLLLLARAASGQALPTAQASPISTGFALPTVEGSLSYAASLSESVSNGYYSSSGEYAATNLSGDVAYISSSKRDPFSMVFSGGRSWANSGEPSSTFLNLGISQVIAARRWTFVLSDAVSYLPQTASAGLSGVPGNGDTGILVGADTGQGVLTDYSTRVTNGASGSVQRQLTGKLSAHASGSFTVFRFVGSSADDGLDSNGESGGVGLGYRIDARNTAGVDYTYARYTYGGNQPGVETDSGFLDYTHQFTRKLTMSVGVGPQETITFDAAQNNSSLNVAANASLGYAAEFTNYTLLYSRGTNAGYGVLLGARSDSVAFTASHRFARVWNAAFTSTYTQTTSIAGTFTGQTSFTSKTLVDSVQLSRALGRNFSVFASYTLENQSTSGSSAAADLFTGLYQVAAFGLTYSPASIHFGRQ